MKTFWNAIAIAAVINLLLLIGGVTWLITQNRLNRQRYDKAVQIFKLTVAQEQKETEQAQKLAEEAKKFADEQQWKATVAQGPRDVKNRLAQDQEAGELRTQLALRNQEDQRVFMDSLDKYKNLINAQKANLDAQRREIDRLIKNEIAGATSNNFKKAVQLYEESSPKQVKRIFVELVAEGNIQQVIDYLAAMKTRQATKVLSQFKDDVEIRLAKDLIEGLRQRGMSLKINVVRSAGTFE